MKDWEVKAYVVWAVIAISFSFVVKHETTVLPLTTSLPILLAMSCGQGHLEDNFVVNDV